MLDQAPIMPAEPQTETQPDNPPVDQAAQARWLAEDHRRSAQVSTAVRTTLSGAGHNSPGSAVLLSSLSPRLTSLLKEAAGRLQTRTSITGQVSPAAEWMLDNYHIAAQALAREVQQDLPPYF